MHLTQRLQWLRIFALFGMLISAFLLQQHYAPSHSPLCIFGDYFVCPLATTPYAQVDGIFHFLAVDLGLQVPLVSFPFPNSLLTFLGFFFLFFVALHLQHRQPTFGLSPRNAVNAVKVLFYVLAAYMIYLTYVETYILYTLCLFCLLLTLLIFGSLWLLVGLHLSLGEQPVAPRRSARLLRRK